MKIIVSAAYPAKDQSVWIEWKDSVEIDVFPTLAIYNPSPHRANTPETYNPDYSAV